jgi:hypothetical protein
MGLVSLVVTRCLNFCFLTLVVVFLNTALAASVTASVDRIEARVEEQLVLTVRVDGARRAQIQLPSFDGFVVRSRGSTSERTIVNGRQSIAVVYTYVLIPQQKGVLKVGAVGALVNGQQLHSEPFTVTIVARDQLPAGQEPLFITSSVSNSSPWVGEQIAYTLRFYRRVRIADAQLQFEAPAGLHSEDVGRQNEFNTTIKGQAYVVTEIRKALFPSISGSLTIPPASISADVLEESGRRGLLGFANYSRRPMTVESAPQPLEVRALPDAPAEFAGVVGDVRLQARLGARRIGAGQSTSLELTVGGPVLLDALPDLTVGGIEDLKTYEGEPAVRVDRSGPLLNSWKQLQVALVPSGEGRVQIPAIALTIFDPAKGDYRKVEQGPFVFEVVPGLMGPPQSAALAEKSVLVGGDELAPNDARVDSVTSDSQRPLQWALMAGPGAAVLTLWGVRRRRQRWASDHGLRRRSQARARAEEGLAALSEAEGGRAAGLYSKVLRAYIGDKLGAEGVALTPAEVERLLQGSPVDPSAKARLITELRWSEELRYGNRAEAPDANALVSKARGLIAILEEGL